MRTYLEQLRIELTTGKLGKGMSLNCLPQGVNGEAFRVILNVDPCTVVGSFPQRSARMSGSDIGLMAASRAAVVAHVGTSPDSLIPSRIAAFSTMYASQHVTNSDITPIAAENKNARPTASLNAASIGSSVVVPPIIGTPSIPKNPISISPACAGSKRAQWCRCARQPASTADRGHAAWRRERRY